MIKSSAFRRCVIASFLLTVFVLAGCGNGTVGVDVHGVNYARSEFDYLLIDPSKPGSSSAGEHVSPFAAGGTTCCYPLPKKWRPGIKVRVRTTHWLPEDRDGKLPEVTEQHVAEVPPYVDGKPGELWVVRGADGAISVVSSDYQPDHPKWPGKLKGWPVPSLEYQRERWELIKRQHEAFVRAYVTLLEKLKISPNEEAKEAWEHAKKYEESTTVGFRGPNDPRYIAALRERYLKELEESKAELAHVMENRP